MYHPIRQWRRAHRQRSLQKQLPEVMRLLTQCLRAGLNMTQSFEHAASESAEPMRTEMQQLCEDLRLGQSLLMAVSAWSERVGGGLARQINFALHVLHSTGGNMADVFTRLLNLDAAEQRLRDKQSAMSAQAVVSAAVIALLPVAMGVVLSLMMPHLVQALFGSALGIAVLVVAGLLQGAGLLWMRHIMKVRV